MHNKGTKMFGTFRASPGALSNIALVRRFMTELVRDIGMTELGTHFYDVPMSVKRLGQEPINDEGGLTALTVLSTSHIAIHTWPEDSGARFDVDSCRAFDPSIVKSCIERVFESSELVYEVRDWGVVGEARVRPRSTVSPAER